MQFNKAQIIIISVLLGMVGLLVYLNYKSSTPDILPETSAAKAVAPKEFDFAAYISQIKDTASPELKSLLASQEERANSADARLYEIAALANTWDSLGYRLASAYYFSGVAQKLNDENSWFNTGMKFYEFAATTDDTAMQVFASKQAIIAFEKVAQLNPDNLDAKNSLAICYIQNDMDIMKGVQMLKDVTKRDSNNIEANYTLGMLSMRSGQTDKALGRFQTLVRIQPSNAEFHYYLGEAYKQLGNKKEAIREFETFKTLVPDQEAKNNIDITINNLKNLN